MADLANLQTDIGLKWYLQMQRKRRISRAAEAAEGPPQNLTQPASVGANNNGGTAETTDGEWQGGQPITFEYQWQLDGIDIPGATAKTLIILVGMVGKALRCAVKATNSKGFNVAYTVSFTVTL